MSVRERVGRGQIATEHIVQFFDGDESRAECVAAFIAEGFLAGEPVIVVARPQNWTNIFEQLEDRGIPVTDAVADGRIVVKDAAETLRRICRNGSPDAAAFDPIAKSVAAMAQRANRRVRAYGEMVDMLAQRGELVEAIALEALWNRLGEHVPLLLLCGYSAAHFVAASTHRALREICSAHSDVHRHAQDPLASWLLNSAHNAAGAAAITH